jgi:DNA-binding beta-propeller fold protein YncE
MLRNRIIAAIYFICVLSGCVPMSRVIAQTYQPIGEYAVPGAVARGIAVDSVSRRLFVANGQGIAVLNVDNGAVIGNIALKNSQDVLLIPVMNGDEQGASVKGFASSDDKVAAFSVVAMKIDSTEALPTSGNSSLCYDSFANTVAAVSTGGSIASFDADSGKLIKSANVQTGDGQIACGTLDHVYVADSAANVIHVLNYGTGTNDGDYPIMTGSKPSGLSLDTKGRRLFVACEDGVIEVIDTDSGFTFIELKGAPGPARETFAWTPQGQGGWKAAAFIASESGALTAVKMNAYINYSVGAHSKIASGLHSIAYDSKTHHLFITAMHSGKPVVLIAGYDSKQAGPK